MSVISLKYILLCLFIGQLMAYAFLFHSSTTLALESSSFPNVGQETADNSPYSSATQVTIHASVLVLPEFANFIATRSTIESNVKVLSPGQDITLYVYTPSPDGGSLPSQLIKIICSALPLSLTETSDHFGTAKFQFKIPTDQQDKLRVYAQNLTYQQNGTYNRPIDISQNLSIPVVRKFNSLQSLNINGQLVGYTASLLSSLIKH